MQTVHVYISEGRFSSFEALRQFIDPSYTADGDRIDSEFMNEVGLESFEPGCIEAIHSPAAISLDQLLDGASYSNQWLPCLSQSAKADSAICVFEPNILLRPQGGSLQYCGAFSFKE